MTKGIGLVARTIQITAGGEICYASVGSLCGFFGAPLIAHGANNVYENGKYFIDGDKNAAGVVREGYQYAAERFGYSKLAGNMAYYGTDLILAGYGWMARTNTFKNPAGFMLFRRIPEDYLKGGLKDN